MKKNRSRNGDTSVMPEYGGHVVNENGILLEDLIMCGVLGIKKIPKGYHVRHRNGNTLDNRETNLDLVND